MKRYLEHMTGIGACLLHVYPSSVAALARFCRRAGIQPPDNIQGIIAESEIVYPEQRQMVEEVFGCRYFSCYGHTEKLVLAAECEHSHDYHVWPTYGYFELLDEEGNPVTTPGQRGEIVGTGLINTVMPFIRYRTGDWATYVGDRCEACGREHPIITDITGRWPQGELIADDDSVITMTTLNVHDDTFENILEYQFVQSVPGKATLCVVPIKPLNEDEKRRIITNMNKRLQGQVVLDLRDTNRIDKNGAWKTTKSDSEVHNENITDRDENLMVRLA